MQKQVSNDGSVDPDEVWMDVRNYESRYQISSFGRVKSLERFRRGKNNSLVPVPERIMRLTTKKDNGRTRPYVEVKFRNGGLRTERSKSFLVHRLVADAFIKPLEDGEQVDHINSVHGDNRAVNLRVLKMIEHARLHSCVINPNPRDLITGNFVKKER